MKENSQDSLATKQINTTLDTAIDNMDLETIEKQLTQLEDLSSQVEDSRLFAKRIINQNKKGNDFMKKSYRKLGKIAVSIAGVLLIGGGTVYATGIYKTFTFFDKETTTFVKTTDQKAKDKELERLAKESSESYGNPHESSENVMEVQKKMFESVKEVKEQLNIDIAVPNYIPEGLEQGKEIYVETTEHEAVGRTDRVYTTYRSVANEDKRFGITVIKEEMKQEVTSIVTMDAVYKDKYTNRYGDEYMLFDEDGGIIAQTSVGNVEYLLVFMGVDEDEIYKTIDSVDLSVYGN